MSGLRAAAGVGARCRILGRCVSWLGDSADRLHAVLQLFVWPAALHRSHSTHIMLVKTSHPLRGFTGGAHCCRGGCSGVDIVHCGCRSVSRYCVLQCVWSPRCCCHYYSHRQAAGRHSRGCCSVWPGRLQCLCSLQHRHALHHTVATSRVHPTLTNKYISQTGI